MAAEVDRNEMVAKARFYGERRVALTSVRSVEQLKEQGSVSSLEDVWRSNDRSVTSREKT